MGKDVDYAVSRWVILVQVRELDSARKNYRAGLQEVDMLEQTARGDKPHCAERFAM